MDHHTHRLISEIIIVLERHGHHARDPEHAGRAVNVIAQLVGIYDGTSDLSAGAGRHAAPSPLMPRPEPDSDAIILTGADISTVLAALDQAAEYRRELAYACASCTDQSCASCQLRHKAADGFDRLANRIYDDPRPVGRAQPEPGHPGASPGEASPGAGKEAGQ